MKRTDEIQMRDPFVLPAPELGKYFLFGTTDRDCWNGQATGFDVYSGSDLESWDGPFPAFRPGSGFWADRNFWAPESHAYSGKYYLFASFKSADAARGTQILVADRAEGPYLPHSDGPVTPRDWECLDGTFHVDDSGDPWIVFCHEWIQVGDGEVRARRLSRDLREGLGESILLFRASEAVWTRPPRSKTRTIGPGARVTDGPFLWRTKAGDLFMLWSSFSEKGYSMGLARSESGAIGGPWIQEKAPIADTDSGHGMLFRSLEGKIFMTIHAPNDTPRERPVFVEVEERDGSIRARVTSREGSGATGGSEVADARFPVSSGALVEFDCTKTALAAIHRRALVDLGSSTLPSPEGDAMLIEGGPYRGCWLESSGSISAEILSRFSPGLAAATFSLFARHLREDGLMPYKILGAGAAYRQIQMVTPLARSVWNHYLLCGRDRSFLATMYGAMSRFDDWLARHRDTRKTGCVEAFCAFDTGHDLSPRFWHVPDTCYGEDAARFDPDSPLLPFLAPDLTANVACQRRYLARIARELGEGPRGSSELRSSTGLSAAREWEDKAQASETSLMRECFDAGEGFFYDRDAGGNFVRVQSDVLLRVLACEIGDDALFESSLRRYLLNTRKFFSRYPFTSIAMDDPRFDPESSYNSWGGPVNFLSLARAPAAFEHHGRHVELSWVMQPIIEAASRFTKFPQCISPWTGEEGFTHGYTPAMLCLLDYIERLCGIMPRPDGKLWFTGLLPACLGGVVASGTGIVAGTGVVSGNAGDAAADRGQRGAGAAKGNEGAFTTYKRTVDGSVYTLRNTAAGCVVRRDGEVFARFPAGIRLVTGRSGELIGLVGMRTRRIEGTVVYMGRERPFSVGGNEEQVFAGEGFTTIGNPGVVRPAHQ